MAETYNQYDSKIKSRLSISETESKIQSRLIVDDSDGLGDLSSEPVPESSLLAEGVGAADLSFISNRHPVQQGVIWAEILGKPVGKRRSRGRYGL